MKLIPLSNGGHTIVDDKDFKKFSKHKWYKWRRSKDRTYYAIGSSGPFRHKKLHALILGDAVERDHRDGNGLNNQRKNLRPCDKQQNQRNRKAQKNNKLGLKGVIRRSNKFQAVIHVNRKQEYIGIFKTPQMASRAYQKRARQLFGEFYRP